jgi:hypothetical protein
MAERRKKSVEKDISRATRIEQALETLQKLGFKITPPSTTTDIQAHEASLDLLGIVTTPTKIKGKKKVQPKESTHLRGTLNFRHVVGGNTYGPGILELPPTDKDLFSSLLKQDQLCTNHYQEPFLPQSSQCFIVKAGIPMAKSTYTKVPVNEGIFNSGSLWNDFVTITV